MRKDERHQKLLIRLNPRAADCLASALEPKPTRVALRLIDGGGDILVFPFCLDDSDASCPDEKRIVRRPALRRPFGNRHVAPLRWPDTGAVAQRRRIRFPAARAKMSIDQRPGRGLVNIDRCRRVFGLRNYGGRCLRRCCRGSACND